MGTPALIGIIEPDKTITAVRCNYDGYVSHAGKMLVENFDTEEKVRELFSYGDMSAIGAKIGTKHDFKSHHAGNGEMCLFYGRDRGEENVDALHYSSKVMLVREGEGYNYIFNPETNCWVCFGYTGRKLSLTKLYKEKVGA